MNVSAMLDTKEMDSCVLQNTIAIIYLLCVTLMLNVLQPLLDGSVFASKVIGTFHIN